MCANLVAKVDTNKPGKQVLQINGVTLTVMPPVLANGNQKLSRAALALIVVHHIVAISHHQLDAPNAAMALFFVSTSLS